MQVLLRAIAYISLLLLMLIGGLVIILNVIDWNHFREPIGDISEHLVGRRLAIQGDLSGRVSFTPEIIAKDITFENAAWSAHEQMITADHLKISFQLWPLLRGRLRAPVIELHNASLSLETTADMSNWSITEADDHPTEGESIQLPFARHVDVTDINISYSDLDSKRTFHFKINELTIRSSDQDGSMELNSSGMLNDKPWTLVGKAGSELEFEQPDGDYPVSALVTLADVELDLDGSLSSPTDFKQAALNVRVATDDIAPLLAIAGVQIDPTESFQLTTSLSMSTDKLEIRQLEATLGESFIYGSFVASMMEEKPHISTDLTATKVRQSDLSAFISAGEDVEQVDASLFPDTPLPSKLLDAVDADFTLRLKEYDSNQALDTILDQLEIQGTLAKGQLTIDPISIGLAGGEIAGQLVVESDSNQDSVYTTLELGLSHLDLATLTHPFTKDIEFDELYGPNLMSGLLVGKVNLTTSGQTVRDLAHQLDGQIHLTMEKGQIALLIIGALGIDLPRILTSLLRDQPKTDINCLLADYKVIDGVITTQSFLVSTDESNIIGSGHIDLVEETVELSIETRAKDFGVGVIDTPIQISGPIKEPSVRPGEELALRAGAATALGAAIGPAVAALAVLEPGFEADGMCRKFADDLRGIQKEAAATIKENETAQ